MMYQKSSQHDGFILVDILLALALSAVFVSFMTELSVSSNLAYNSAKNKYTLIRELRYDMQFFGDIKLGEVKAIKDIEAEAKKYGNDRVEVTYTISTSTKYHSSTTTDVDLKDSIVFTSIIKISGINSSQPICSAYFSLGEPIGSYYFQNKFNDDHIPTLIINRISLPISSNLTDLQVRNGIAYISANSTVSSDPDIIIANIKDIVHPAILSTIDSGPGLSAISLHGNYIFAAAASTAGQLHIFKINDLKNLTLIKKYQLPLPYATSTPPLADSITFDNRKVYLGTDKWEGAEFSIIDVSEPTRPNRVGSLEIGSKVSDIEINNNFAYLSTAGEQQLQIINVANPANPTVSFSFSPSGFKRQEGQVINIFEDSLNFGRTSGGFDISKDHELFGWQTILSSSSPIYSENIPGGNYGIISDRFSIFTANGGSNPNIQVSNHSLATSTIQVFHISDQPQKMTCDGNKLYILSKGSPVIYQVEVGSTKSFNKL